MNRRKIKKVFLEWLFMILVLNGCVETTDIDLDTAAPQLVVEGKITEGKDTAYVKLSLSSPFYSTVRHYVEDATVKISDDQGNVALLQYEQAGKYVTSAITGVSGRKYHLEINYHGKNYEAWTTMPEPPKIDSIEVQYYQENILKEEGYYLIVKGIDSDLEDGYYRLLVYQNDKLYNPLGNNDLFASIAEEGGKGIEEFEVPVAFKMGDTINMNIIKMGKSAYVFYQSYLLLLLNDGGLFGSPPANPESNISNGALGLFQAVSILKKEVIVSERD